MMSERERGKVPQSSIFAHRGHRMREWELKERKWRGNGHQTLASVWEHSLRFGSFFRGWKGFGSKRGFTFYSNSSYCWPNLLWKLRWSSKWFSATRPAGQKIEARAGVKRAITRIDSRFTSWLSSSGRPLMCSTKFVVVVLSSSPSFLDPGGSSVIRLLRWS